MEAFFYKVAVKDAHSTNNNLPTDSKATIVHSLAALDWYLLLCKSLKVVLAS